MIAAGRTGEARARARRLLAEKAGPADAVLCLTAESVVHDRRYAEARDADLGAWRARPRSAYGARALYTAGVLELKRDRLSAVEPRSDERP
jgi:hypothetical protein